MPKKNQKLRKLVEEIEPFEPPAKSKESDSSEPQGEALPSGTNPQVLEEPVEITSEAEEASTEIADSLPDQDPAEMPASDQPSAPGQESVEDDLLADVRQSLIEEESIEEQKPQ